MYVQNWILIDVSGMAACRSKKLHVTSVVGLKLKGLILPALRTKWAA